MSAAKSSAASATQDREIVIARLFDAPRALVFAAFTDAKHIGEWWGPNGFTTTTYEMDVRPGGAWRYVMHGPDGTDYSNKIAYTEVVKPERLVYAHGEDDDGPPLFHATVTFEEQGGKTLVTMRSIFPSAAIRDRTVKEYGAIEGGKQTLERLAKYLAKQS
jgi:uncharacterized protein YndB with AHSA1/START domain